MHKLTKSLRELNPDHCPAEEWLLDAAGSGLGHRDLLARARDLGVSWETIFSLYYEFGDKAPRVLEIVLDALDLALESDPRSQPFAENVPALRSPEYQEAQPENFPKQTPEGHPPEDQESQPENFHAG